MTTNQRKQPLLSQIATASLHTQTVDADTVTDTSPVDYAQLFIHLLSIGQLLYDQAHEVADRLCQEVALVTQGRAQLFLRHRTSLDRAELPSLTLSVSFPVQFRSMIYGTLYIASDPVQPAYLALPLTIAHLLAQACGCILYTLELSALLQGQYRRSDQQAQDPLTKRQQEILTLMCRGYNQDAIARTLSIAPATVSKHRQQIYRQLDVHCERDALLAAYQSGLFSPLAKISN